MLKPSQLGQAAQGSPRPVDGRDATPERRPAAAESPKLPSTPPQRREQRGWRAPPRASSVGGLAPELPRPPASSLPTVLRQGPTAPGRSAPHPIAAALTSCARHLSLHLCQPGQPLHACLSRLYDDAQMASREISRSLTMLRGLADKNFREVHRRGKVAVLLPDAQPLYALVSQVLLAATLSEQVRATTRFGRAQGASRKIFGWLAQSLQATVTCAADHSTQQWQAEALGSMMLVHPDSGGSNMQLSLALPARPDAILWQCSVDRARQLSLQAGGCSVLIPSCTTTCTVVAAQPTANMASVAASVAAGCLRHAYRPGALPAVVLLHAEVAAVFFAQLLERLTPSCQVQPLGENRAWARKKSFFLSISLATLSATDRASALAAERPTAAGARHLELNMLTYRRDEELVPYFADLATNCLQVSLFGISPAVAYAVSEDRLRLGRTVIEAEDQLAARGGGEQLSLCRVQGEEVRFSASSAFTQLRLALCPPGDPVATAWACRLSAS